MGTFGNTKRITKLSIFDFDGTLISTPLPDTGRIEYHVKTGSPWPHEGWWGRHESLDMTIFDMPTLEEVIEAYVLEYANPSTAVVLLTGRLQKLSKHVKAILEAKNLTFDEYHFNRGGGTEFAKMKSMDKLLEKYPEVIEMEQWDDRLAHIPIFEDWGRKQCDSGRLKSYKINIVRQDSKDGLH